ncbi:transketolase C-terminal domain-containing protein [Desulfobulbus alkaliphilus]|uniref:transketolase C-terminal domain-containing protein n=1 Tax=Desulfobulbus alkaliphilus TaxID=869814 RepID=UPI0019647ECC|nr:transketolase C-terminal domain-containing protein [Desulfobulbus alkaliphilus]MBM9538281.1 transketolase [Desulfobulbus alkaliphilus]
MNFPIDLSAYTPVSLTTDQTALSTEQRATLLENIRLARDSIVFFTALANTKGLGGHTGGAYDIVPELLIADGFIKGTGSCYPVYFDEAGHRVAIQYLMAVLNGFQPAEWLLHYREFGQGLYGHPERQEENGIFFSSGRLGHLWSHVNGVAEAHPGQTVFLFGSDGSQQEGGDAEAARYAVARGLSVKLLVDDNNVTIAGHPSVYMPGYDLARTLAGHGLTTSTCDGEDIDALFACIHKAIVTPGPVAVVIKRPMAVGVPGIEGLPKGHDVIPVPMAIEYLTAKGRDAAVALLKEEPTKGGKVLYRGSSPESDKNRDAFGRIVADLIKGLNNPVERVLVVDSDLEGSCGLHHIRKNCPEVYVHGGIMERNNFSVAAGFGSIPGKQGIYGTFSAFQEMVISEITMARLNQANVLAHFSHSGVDDMADNTCHFGLNNFFADNGLAEHDRTRLYFPADTLQLEAVLRSVFHDPGLRFIYSTRSGTPFILNEQGNRFFEAGYTFAADRDEVIREGRHGYIVSYGEMLYRCLHVVELLREEGVHIGLINKPVLNVVDESMLALVGSSPSVLVVETQNVKTGLGIRYGTWLLERGYTPKYGYMGSWKDGAGGLSEQIPYQGMGTDAIREQVMRMHNS